MMKVLSALAVLTASAQRPARAPIPVQPPKVVACSWWQPASVERTKIISVATCPWASSSSGYWSLTFGTTPLGAANYVANANPAGAGPEIVTLYCDALLPADVTSFDYAELEYFAPDEPGNSAPWLGAYLDVEGININGFTYSQTGAVGSCAGTLTPRYSGTNPLSMCSTAQSQAFDFDGGGFPGYWSAEDWIYPSMHFLVSIPASPDPELPNLAYRIVVHFHAP